MMYNLDFLIAGMVFLILILYHFTRQRRLRTISSQVFFLCVLLGLLDVSLDFLTSLLIEWNQPALRGVTMLLLTAFFLAQISVPCILFFYTQSLHCDLLHVKRDMLLLWAAPAVCFCILLLLNPATRWFFWLDLEGNYCKGPLYLSTYLHALFYGALIALTSFIHRKEMGGRKFLAVWEFLTLMVVSIGIQAVTGTVMMTGFGISLGILLMYLMLSNPSEQTDNLTGVFDIQCFHEWVRSQFEWKRRFHVLTVEVWQLKRINMVFGTSYGDELLKCVAARLQELDGEIQVFRVAGNRFLLLMPTLRQYEMVKNRLQQLFSGSFRVRNENVVSPVVITGIMDAQELEDGDNLLTYIEYLVSLTPQVENYMIIQGTEHTMQGYRYQQEVEQFLKTAIEQDLFEVYYQPVYSLETGNYVTLEALSRLRHPSLGMISPDIFITIAEQSGQISRIGYLQFCKVVKFLDSHRELMKTIQNVKYNLSPAELLQKESTVELLDLLRLYHIPPSWIQFEITETVATEYIDQLYQSISEIRKEGIHLCLDDFGSGYANLNTVLKLPFSAIKLDRSMLSGILDDEKIAEFYRQMVQILKGMGYKIISEGVESLAEVRMLDGWGVDMIQGFYFSRPVPENQIEETVKMPPKWK